MKKICWVPVIMMAFMLVAFQISPAHALAVAKVIVKVMDEAGAPVNNAHLSIRFSSDSATVKGFTDDHGIFEVKAMSNDGVILGDITKEGYYESGLAHSFHVTRLGMWQPWGKELTVVMRPIVNPVPMYVRNQWFEIPEVNKEIGFDLVKADWVIPYGQGTQADFIFKVERKYESDVNFDAKLTLTFSNPFDGIQGFKDDGGGDFNIGSWYRLPRMAPDVGYQAKLEKIRSTSSLDFYAHKPDDDNYIFRVRSEVDKEGKLKKAMYGKIRGSIAIEPRNSQTGIIKLHYYLNPDHTPNLEFDPTRNLFIQLSGSENVTQP